MAGGVALNCVANGKLLKEGVFDAIWIQPAAGDAGGAVGAALAGHHLFAGGAAGSGRPARRHVRAPISGPSFSDDDVAGRLRRGRCPVFDPERRPAHRPARRRRWRTARRSAGCRAAWSSGRGRSATARSSAIPRSPTMQKVLNLKVKYRESFRPFAPSVLREDVQTWFDLDCDSPYMLLVGSRPARASARHDLRRSRRCSASTSSTCRAPRSRP